MSWKPICIIHECPCKTKTTKLTILTLLQLFYKTQVRMTKSTSLFVGKNIITGEEKLVTRWRLMSLLVQSFRFRQHASLYKPRVCVCVCNNKRGETCTHPSLLQQIGIYTCLRMLKKTSGRRCGGGWEIKANLLVHCMAVYDGNNERFEHKIFLYCGQGFTTLLRHFAWQFALILKLHNCIYVASLN